MKVNFSKIHAPRWVVLLIDTIIVSLSIFLVYQIRFNFSFSQIDRQPFSYAFAIIVPLRILSFIISKTYQGIVRYTSTNDAIRITVVNTITSIAIFAFSQLAYSFQLFNSTIPLSVIALECIFSTLCMIISRFLVKSLYFETQQEKYAPEYVVIYGANEFAITTMRTLDNDKRTNYKVVAFIDQNNLLIGKSIEGIKVVSEDALDVLVEKYDVKNLIFSGTISKRKKQNIIDYCLAKDVKVLSTPKINDWINGKLSLKQIKNIRIEDLLERDPIVLDEMQIRKDIFNKVVMVSGAAGSIGSEIVRQLTKFNPKKIIVFDQAESPLYDLELELNEKLEFNNYQIIIGSITDELRLKHTFEEYHPSIIFHAAAYKHVPMMENNPTQAIRNNVYGTMLLSNYAVKYGVEKFVMVSTDKAVNPTNVMGCSKRLCEIYTQSFNKVASTKFITTRFGNVLGSNGSVIPRFKAQIEAGGPVTVTHPEITRFFMTIPEACQLVLQAGTQGNGGEIFVFDMGKSVKIVDLAKKMIKLSGFELDKDIQIKFTGLRPGEKLYEEVLNEKEKVLPTIHNQIMVAKVREYDFENVKANFEELLQVLQTQDNFKIVAKMKEIVPEFKSENSIYEVLDQKENQTKVIKIEKVG